MCNYCSLKYPITHVENSEDSFYIKGNIMYFEKYLPIGEEVTGQFEINYCPLCGEKL